MTVTAADRRHMKRCLVLARQAEGRTSPNPIVGCVIVGPDGRVLAEGFHRAAGEPHAEAEALARLEGRAEGATMYVSLEPCSHTGARRTEPCLPRVAASGVRRLVFGMHDPFPGHGGGMAALEEGGIQVDGPCLEEECARANEVFRVFATQQRAHVTLKAAVTLDGRIATATGESRWITGEAARAEAHAMRDRADAILVGAGTVLADDPQLTTRGVRGGRDPLRIVLDGRRRVSPAARVFTVKSEAGAVLATVGSKAPVAGFPAVWELPGEGDRVNLRALLERLAAEGKTRLLVEGGAETHAAFVTAGLVDRVTLFVAPRLVGGDAPTWLADLGVARLADTPWFRLDEEPRLVGQDLLLSYRRQ